MRSIVLVSSVKTSILATGDLHFVSTETLNVQVGVCTSESTGGETRKVSSAQKSHDPLSSGTRTTANFSSLPVERVSHVCQING
jgi:hypothetical protein